MCTTTFSGLNAVVNGVVFYGTAGPINVSWSAQSCDGQYSFNMNSVLAGAGVPQESSVAMQAWSRDPGSTKTTQLSDSLTFVVGP